MIFRRRQKNKLQRNTKSSFLPETVKGRPLYSWSSHLEFFGGICRENTSQFLISTLTNVHVDSLLPGRMQLKMHLALDQTDLVLSFQLRFIKFEVSTYCSRKRPPSTWAVITFSAPVVFVSPSSRMVESSDTCAESCYLVIFMTLCALRMLMGEIMCIHHLTVEMLNAQWQWRPNCPLKLCWW